MRDRSARNRIPMKLKLGLMLAVVLGCGAIFVSCTMVPVFGSHPPSALQQDPARLRRHVEKFSGEWAPRDYRRVWNLDKCADYIVDQFRQAGGEVSEQTYEVDGQTYRNIRAQFGPFSSARIVVGAHYDGYGDTPGADDNASGMAGLIELAYLLGKEDLHRHVELVAYTLEEPPFFRTPDMGSARHAWSLKNNDVEVEAMICLEMIGCFNDEEGSQRYPSMLLKWLYPDTGNFIAVIGSVGDRRLARKVKQSMRGATDLPVHAMCAPKGFPGLDFSDHRNYWNNGYTAVMVTDTAFMRNLHYHGATDTADTLDYDRMAKVVVGVYEAVLSLANDRH